jgi:(E)-4-hydroxy-3-methyl-but-2-enyl pyrophosphate reductase
MKVTLDPYAGFCFGVKKAIQKAEEGLQQNQKLFCLGEIVHNDEEIQRLEKSGLSTLHYKDLENIQGAKIMFRAHGEPPSTYENARKNNFEIIDATCPVVLKFQEKVKQAFKEMQLKNGQIVIAGNKNHPEVIGLKGQTEGTAIIIESVADINKINFRLPVRLFIQTTKNKEFLDEIVKVVLEKYLKLGITNPDFKYHNTICGQVSGRIPRLKEFCSQNEVIIFVSGKNSSNGKQLFNICQSMNPRSYFISSPGELKSEWYNKAISVGVSGATSTPGWLMKKIADNISTH